MPKALATLTVAEVEYLAHKLAQEHLTFNEPIPDFSTRFPGKLESCLAMPFQKFSRKSLYQGLLGKAAMMFYLMVKNHPFQNLPAPRPNKYYVYAIKCDASSLYIGQTEDLQKRWYEHVSGEAAGWTKLHIPLYIAHFEEYLTRKEAVKREHDLKTGYGRKWLKREIEAGRARQAGGNKRIAMTSVFVLLHKNGKWLQVDTKELYNFAVWVAESNSRLKDEVVSAIEKFFKAYVKEL